MLSILLLSDVATSFVAAELKDAFEVHEAPGYGQYAFEFLRSKEQGAGSKEQGVRSKYGVRVLVLEGESSVEIPDDVVVIRARAVFGGCGVEPRPLDDFYDARMAKLAGCPWSLKGIKAIAQAVRDALAPKKVLALDYDGTLWRGIFSEEGTQCVVRGDVQERALDLKRAGLLLVGLSKNNPEDIAAVWQLPGMRLTPEDFILTYVDWQPKADNIARAAKRLNLGLSSFVFVDDRPVERERMHLAHPEVTCLSPEDLLKSTLAPCSLLLAPSSVDKTAEYRAQLARWDDYLENLEIKTDIHPVRPDEYARVAELSQRSNQFNCTTRRFTEADIARLAADPDVKILTLATSDKYGDLGLVAFCIAHLAPITPHITDFVMSCRAMNRGHEDQLWEAAGKLPIDFKETAKNAPAKEFVWRTQH